MTAQMPPSNDERTAVGISRQLYDSTHGLFAYKSLVRSHDVDKTTSIGDTTITKYWAWWRSPSEEHFAYEQYTVVQYRRKRDKTCRGQRKHSRWRGHTATRRADSDDHGQAAHPEAPFHTKWKPLPLPIHRHGTPLTGDNDSTCHFSHCFTLPPTYHCLSMQHDDLPREELLDDLYRLNSAQEIKDQHYHKQDQYRAQKEQNYLQDIDFEGILNLIGGCSKWQILVYLIISAHKIPIAMYNLNVVYMMYQPDHWCTVPGFTKADVNNTTYTWDDLLNSNILYPKTQGNVPDQCQYFNRNYSMLNELDWEELKTLEPTEKIHCTEWQFDRSVMINTVVTQFKKVCDSNIGRGHVHLAYCMGFVVGCLLGGYVSDRFGRKVAIVVFSLLSIMCAVMMNVAREFPVFLLFRFLLAATSEAADLALYVLCMEVTGVTYRSSIGSLLHAPWSLGYSFLALLAYLLRDWKSVHMITLGLHVLAFVVVVLLLPESPRWLIINNEITRAEAIIRRACHYNNSRLPSDLELVRHAEKRKWMVERSCMHYTSLFSPGRLGMRNVLLMLVWTSTALVYYGVVIALSDQSTPGRSIFAGNFFLNNAIAGMIELPTLFVCVVLLRSGRKGSLMLTLVGSGVSILISVFAMNYNMTTVSLVATLAGKAFIQAAFNIIYIFTAELNPTVVRNSAVGINSMVSRLGSGASGYIVIMSDQMMPTGPMVAFATFALTAGVMGFFFPETQDQPLPDTILDAVKMESEIRHCIGSPRNSHG